MPRHDLLSLTPDDLASITNQGTVKRAERELEEGSLSCAIQEDGNELVVRWSDGIVCRFPAGKTMQDAVCSSGISGISRHVVRSVLAYQRHSRQVPDPGGPTSNPAADSESVPSNAVEPVAWDPGAFTDAELVATFRQAAVSKARQRFEQGVLVELTRGLKPVARFLDSPCTLRFLVRGDLRYVSADCDPALLATFVPLAVWAFRELPADQAAGLISFQQTRLDVPVDVLGQLDSLLIELAISGISGAPSTWTQRAVRLEGSLRKSGLVWPAELLADLHEQLTAYQGHDARFDPAEAVSLVGELLARTRAIASGTTAVPQLLIRGSASDRVTEIASGRLIGLGLGVRLGRRVTTLSAYVQDADSGSLAAVERSFADPLPDSGEAPKSFAELAATGIVRGVSIGGLSQSQLLLKSGKRTPSGRLILPRTAASLTANPQGFVWEQLKPPAAVESFGQLASRLAALPPAYLRPRSVTENLYVMAVQRVDGHTFNESQQRLEAVLHDDRGSQARLMHRYHSRGRAGFEALSAALAGAAGDVRFVCGHVSRSGEGLTVHPILLVCEHEGRRIGVQPNLSAPPTAVTAVDLADVAPEEADDPLPAFFERIQFELAELLLSGQRRCGAQHVRAWSELQMGGQQLGFVRLVERIRQLQELLASKAESLHWDPTPAARLTLELCLQARVAIDLVAA